MQTLPDKSCINGTSYLIANAFVFKYIKMLKNIEIFAGLQLLEGGIHFPLCLTLPILATPQIFCHLKGLVGSQKENLYPCCSTGAGQGGCIEEQV